MDKHARMRWTFLLAGLAGTLIAAFAPLEEAALATANTVPLARQEPRLTTIPPSEVAIETEPEGETDPFAPRGWQAPAPIAPASLTVAPLIVASSEPAAPPGPPPLPFRFVGSLKDGDQQLVYLARGEEAIVARSGEVLEATYKVTGISASQIEFEHIPTGQKQALVFPVRDN